MKKNNFVQLQSFWQQHWLALYRREWLAGDIIAGFIVALVLVPQGMAYAVIAGLPPVTGLYASILPALAYAALGSSMTQSVGPMAITSLLTATALAPLAVSGSADHVLLAGQVALLAGVLLLLCGLLKLGKMVNFLSRPVLTGFTNGVVLLIVLGQLKSLLGAELPAIHPLSAALGFTALLVLWLIKQYLPRILVAAGTSENLASVLSRLGPVVVLGLAIAAAMRFNLDQLGVRLVGAVPSGLPHVSIILAVDHWRELMMPSLLLAFIVFVSSMSASQPLARKRDQRIVANRELLGLGAANVFSAVSGGFPVTGGLSRSAVNFAAGANTPLAGIISALLLAAVLCGPTAWLGWLPLPVLAAVILLAVLGMFDLATLRVAWRIDRGDAAGLIATTLGVLAFGVESGIVLGITLSLALIIWRASNPPIVEVGRKPGAEHFRNIERQNVLTLPHVLMLRIDQGLFFGNAEAVPERVKQDLAGRPCIRHVVLLLSAVNGIDTTAMDALIDLNRSLAKRQIQLHLAEAKAPILERLERIGLASQLSGQIFRRAVQAFDALAESA